MRAIFTALTVLSLAACGSNTGDDGNNGPGSPDACVGLECQVVKCQAQQKPSTTIVGTVYAPNGTLPLYGVSVYVPREAPAPFTEGAQCSRCTDELSGSPVAKVQSDDQGHFKLENVPSGDNIPLVITTGKWRRQIVIPRVESCTDTTLIAEDTRLPKNKAEGDIPKIALTTGSADSLECLVRKLGIADSEVTTDTGDGRVHFYAGNGVNKFSNGGNFTAAQTMWGNVDKLKQYDIVLLSCEGGQHPETKPQAALDAMKAYADLGGRVFASHWHNIWVEGSTQGGGTQRPTVWPSIATWTNGGNTNVDTIDLIDEASNPKGSAFASWMLNVMGSTVRSEIPIANVPPPNNGSTGRTTCNQVDPAKGERWTYLKDQGGYTQNFQFTTPNEQPLDTRCGKVVFSDMHVSGGPSGMPYPAGCPLNPLTPQEKALAFMFFDIASCVGPIF
ncbi:MAG TPA: hypothetical protein VN253_00935 [Kofleriaceae bacterium]|nr:hypothetical protein [Kofleriaceae bacterium]